MQDSNHFPFNDGECVMHRQWDSVWRWTSCRQGNWRVRASDLGTYQQGRYRCRPRRHSAVVAHRHRGDKAVSLAIPCLDETLCLSVVAYGLAYGLETVFNSSIADSLSRPYLFTEFLLWNHTVAVRQEIGKHLEHFWSQSDRLASPAQEIALCIQEAIRKEVAHSLDL